MNTFMKFPWHSEGKPIEFNSEEQRVQKGSQCARLGNLLFCSGVTAENLRTGEVPEQDVEAQVGVCLARISDILVQAGSSMDNLVKCTVLLKDYRDAPELWDALAGYFRNAMPGLLNEPPVFTVTQVAALSNPGCLVEIEAIAVADRNMPGWELCKYPLLRTSNEQTGFGDTSLPEICSESAVVGNLVFLSAMDGIDSAASAEYSFEEQWQRALGRMNRAMDRVGSSMSHIIHTLHFQCRLDDLLRSGIEQDKSHSPASDRLWKTELEYFERAAPFLLDEPPSSTFLKVPSLADPSARGQNEGIGVLSRYRKGWEVKNYPCYLGQRGFPRHIGEVKKYYANMVKVGPLLIISGQTPTDVYSARIESNDFESQVTTALNNLRMAVEEAGSELSQLVKTLVLLPDVGQLELFRQLESRYYRKYAPELLLHPPVTTVIHPAGLASPAMKIEIEAIAFVPGSI